MFLTHCHYPHCFGLIKNSGKELGKGGGGCGGVML